MTVEQQIDAEVFSCLQAAVELIQQGNPSQGERRLRQLTAQHPNFLDGWGHLAHLLVLQKRYREALICYQRCHTLAPTLPEVLLMQGTCLSHLEQPLAAVECWHKARELANDPTLALMSEADCLYHAGYHRKAFAIWKHCSQTPGLPQTEAWARLRLYDNRITTLVRKTVRLMLSLARHFRQRDVLLAVLGELVELPTKFGSIRQAGLNSYLTYLEQACVIERIHRYPRHRCDLCGSNRSRPVFFLLDRKVVRCCRCGLERLERIPPGGWDVSTEFYERSEVVENIEQEWASPHVLDHHLSWLQTLFKMDAVDFPTPGQRVFEVGCGGGQMLNYLQQAGLEVAGIDASARWVALVREKYGIPVTQSAVEVMPRPNHLYQIVLCYHVIEHLEFPSMLFEKARELLSPGGYLFIETPLSDLSRVPLELQSHPTHGYGSSEHTFFFTRETLQQYFERFGFTIVGSYQYKAGELDNGGMLGKKLP